MIRGARYFVDSLCNEPIRPELLKLRKREYKPPQFIPGTKVNSSGLRHPKLWLANLVEGRDVPELEQPRLKRVRERAEREWKNKTGSKLTYFNWYKKPKMADVLESGDWIIQIIELADGSILAYPPGSFYRVDSYPRAEVAGKRRWIFHLEVPTREGTIPWKIFRKKLSSATGKKVGENPRTMAIQDEEAANELLSLWNSKGYAVMK